MGRHRAATNALPNSLRAPLIAGSPCIAVEAHPLCRPWHRGRQPLSRDFGTAGICRRPRIAHSRQSPEAAPPEAAFAFQLLVTRKSPSVERPLKRRSTPCPKLISTSSPAPRWRSGERRYPSSPTDPRTRRPAPAVSRPLNRRRPTKRSWRGRIAIALDCIARRGALSIRRHWIPSRASSCATTNPVGPAPTISAFDRSLMAPSTSPQMTDSNEGSCPSRITGSA